MHYLKNTGNYGIINISLHEMEERNVPEDKRETMLQFEKILPDGILMGKSYTSDEALEVKEQEEKRMKKISQTLGINILINVSVEKLMENRYYVLNKSTYQK